MFGKSLVIVHPLKLRQACTAHTYIHDINAAFIYSLPTNQTNKHYFETIITTAAAALLCTALHTALLCGEIIQFL
jgi:hypothetical protein